MYLPNGILLTPSAGTSWFPSCNQQYEKKLLKVLNYYQMATIDVVISCCIFLFLIFPLLVWLWILYQFEDRKRDAWQIWPFAWESSWYTLKGKKVYIKVNFDTTKWDEVEVPFFSLRFAICFSFHSHLRSNARIFVELFF